MGVHVVVSARRVLITGCSGFIGRTLAEECLAEGWAVRGSVRDRSRAALPFGVEPVDVGCVGPATSWTHALQHVDAVVHLAAMVHQVAEKGVSRDAYYLTNTVGTARLARAAAEAGVRRMVFLSTLKVHGEGRDEPFRETDPLAPRGHYAGSKCEAENILREISSQARIETVILRPPLVYGPGVKANFLRLLHLIAREVPLPFKNVENRRSLIYIRNLVDAILVCLNHPHAAGKTFLIADDEAISTPTLIQSIATALRVKVRLFSCPTMLLRIAGQMIGKGEELRRLTGSLWADTSKIRNELCWRPKFSYLEGLKATLSCYRASQSSN